MQLNITAVTLGHIADKVFIGFLVAGVGMVLMWPFRKAKKEWHDLKTALASTQTELTHQRENHLTHIEEHSKTQVELLTKMSDTLDGVRLDLREQTGYLKATADLSRPRPKSLK